MASALKKLFKGTSERLLHHGAHHHHHQSGHTGGNATEDAGQGHHDDSTRKHADGQSPSSQSSTRRFFGSPRRDSKISPASSEPSSSAGAGGLLLSFKSSRSAKQSSEAVARRNQAVRSRRLMKEFQELSDLSREARPPFTVELVDDNLYEWTIRLYQIDPESELYRDMQDFGIDSIVLNAAFPDNFPFSPPFLRVTAPHIEKGFVMEGGAICMELLTPRGWASAYRVEAVVMQFAASLVKGQGRISRKCKTCCKEFNRKSAEASFRSLVKTHEKYGWVTPPLADG